MGDFQGPTVNLPEGNIAAEHGLFADAYLFWLVVSTPLQNISQIGSSSQLIIGENTSHVPNHQPGYDY